MFTKRRIVIYSAAAVALNELHTILHFLNKQKIPLLRFRIVYTLSKNNSHS